MLLAGASRPFIALLSAATFGWRKIVQGLTLADDEDDGGDGGDGAACV